MVPVLHWRACFEMPDMCSSVLFDVTSDLCWDMRVLKFMRVWPTYFLFGSQLHDCRYTPFFSHGSGWLLLALQRISPSLGPGLE